jgi:predicted Zn finger-like uncharacterized protein
MAAALATRCPACSTVFRVVPDQLRVSGGWVRCGRCTEVFDATLSLVDMETGAPRRWADEMPRPAAPPTAATPGPPMASPAPAADSRPAGLGLAPLSAPEPEPEPGLERKHDSGPAPELEPEPEPGPPPPAPAADVTVEATAGRQAEPEAGLPADAPPAGPSLPPGVPEEAENLPSFVRRAQRAERWRRSRWRAALAALALLGLLGLVGQIAHAYRDLVAARYPQTRPMLEQACDLLGCRVEAARAIDALAVESSGLLRVEESNVYRLSLALRNRAGIEVALPALELVLTDTQGRLIARRVLLATELGATAATLGAGADLPLQATLQAGPAAGEPVAGYTIELFYP